MFAKKAKKQDLQPPKLPHSLTDMPSRKVGKIDTTFLLIILILLTFGLIMVFSASYASALFYKDNSLHYVIRQAIFIGAGLVLMIIASFVDYRLYRKLVMPLFIFGVLLLLVVLFIPSNGARRWIYIGGTQFQPSEIMKFALIVMFAHLVSHNYKRMGTFVYGVFPFAMCLIPVVILMMLEPHLSGTILMVLIAFVMMFIGGTKVRYFLGLGVLGIGGVVGLIAIKGVTYMSERIAGWIDPFSDISDKTWQTVQSLVAIGSGGVMGRGLGQSHQKYMYLPEAQNDFIFAIVCEELGFIGAILVIILFLLFALRGFSIASKSPDKFGYMLGVGLTAQIILQAILNIAVVTNTIPNTGISLPFFSYGGTAIMMQLAQMGILLNISRHAAIEKA
ncbi:MAG: putative lipid II flippase FtsW [Oscillospiraceae bacterium]